MVGINIQYFIFLSSGMELVEDELSLLMTPKHTDDPLWWKNVGNFVQVKGKKLV